jgi:hypothetical protein
MFSLRSFTPIVLRAPLAAATVIAIMIALTAAISTAAAQPPQFSEQLTVRERPILVSLPTNLANARLQSGDFQVLVDGQPREVTRAEPLSAPGGAPWTIVVYVDEVLASPATLFASEVALAGHARELSRLGNVEVVTAAGPSPRIVLPATLEARAVEGKLASLASAARIERDRNGGGSGKRRAAPTAAQIGQQVDALLAFLAAHPASGPRLLFLVADGMDLPADQVAVLSGNAPEATAGPASPAVSFRHAARTLAAQGWTVVPLAVRPESPGNPTMPRTNLELFRESAAPSSHTNGPPPDLPPHRRKETPLSYSGVIDLASEPRMATLHTLAEATAGAVVGYEVQLAALLAELPHRWTIWITVPETKGGAGAAGTSALHTLTVKLPGRQSDARAPGWVL